MAKTDGIDDLKQTIRNLEFKTTSAFLFVNIITYMEYRASHIILDYLQSLTPK